MVAAMTNDECTAAWAEGFSEQPPILYRCVSQSHLSVARHYGGCTVNSRRYIYTTADELIRDDVHLWLMKRRKAAQHAALDRMADDAQQLGLGY